MSRLSRYLLGQYARDTLALFAVAAILVWLIQMLRLFDLVTAKGQGMLTLAGQALLTTPPLAREIAYVCMAIGLARGFRALQDSRELHSIHIMQRVSAIWWALAAYAVLGAMLVMLVAHWAAPAAQQAIRTWQAQVAAELVGQTLIPGRFMEVARGVVVHIGGRESDGTISGFFADDNRNPDLRRTYFADSATIIQTDGGFQISLREGRLQILPADDRYSEVGFARYELAINDLTQQIAADNSLSNLSSWVLFERLQNGAGNSDSIIETLNQRFAEGVRILAICLLVGAFWAYPHARRRRRFLPAELLIVGVAFAERIGSNYVGELMPLGMYFGPGAVAVLALAILAVRMKGLVRNNTARAPQRAVPV